MTVHRLPVPHYGVVVQIFCSLVNTEPKAAFWKLFEGHQWGLIGLNYMYLVWPRKSSILHRFSFFCVCSLLSESFPLQFASPRRKKVNRDKQGILSALGIQLFPEYNIESRGKQENPTNLLQQDYKLSHKEPMQNSPLSMINVVATLLKMTTTTTEDMLWTALQNKTYLKICVASLGSDQSQHLYSLIRDFHVYSGPLRTLGYAKKKQWGLIYIRS